MEYNNDMTITILEIGGHDKIRPLWRHYYMNMSALIFVIDSNDKNRINKAKNELWKILNEKELKKDIKILVFGMYISTCIHYIQMNNKY